MEPHAKDRRGGNATAEVTLELTIEEIVMLWSMVLSFYQFMLRWRPAQVGLSTQEAVELVDKVHAAMEKGLRGGK